ncbi:MAG: hypothetical protein ACOYB8_10990 [Eubacteriaceae bacterium]|jgi:hypothetical protein
MNFSELKPLISGRYFVITDTDNPAIGHYYTREALAPALDICPVAGIEPTGCLKKSLFEEAEPDEYVAAVKLVLNMTGTDSDYRPRESSKPGAQPVDDAAKKAIKEAMDKLPSMMPSMDEMVQASAELMKNPELMQSMMNNINMEEASRMFSQMFGQQDQNSESSQDENDDEEFELIDDDE